MPTPFIVLFVARSGSTALFGHLKDHPDVVMRGEVFGNKTLPDGSEQTDDNRLRFLRTFWAPFAPGQPARSVPSCGFKFQVNWKKKQFSDQPRLIEELQAYSPRVIVLFRRNILKQAISAFNARRLLRLSQELTGHRSAHVKTDDTRLVSSLAEKKLHVDIGELKELLAGIKESGRLLEEMAGAFPRALQARYEDLVVDPRGFYREIDEFLGLDPDRHSHRGGYVKITSDTLADVVDNYDELRLFARGTEFENML